jgi:hypothetical protein
MMESKLRTGHRAVALTLALALTVALALATADAARACSINQDTCVGEGARDVVVTNLDTSLAGSVFYSPADELVAIGSRLHLESRYRPDTGELTLHANVAGAKARGEDSGAAYSFTGADRFFPTDPIFPNDPVRTTMSFKLDRVGLPPSPIRIAVGLTLTVDQSGRLIHAVAGFEGGEG